MKSLSRVQLFATPWTIAYQVPRSMGFSRQEYWNGLPFPSPGDLPNQGSNPDLPHCRQTLNHLNHQGSHHGQFSSVQPLSRVRLFATPWTVAGQVPLSMEFSRQACWSGLPLPSPGGRPDSGITPTSPPLAGGFFTTEPPEKPLLLPTAQQNESAIPMQVSPAFWTSFLFRTLW